MNTEECTQKFLKLALKADAVTFGDINLKADEKKSPYFFRSDRFHVGPDLAVLCRLYARTIVRTLGKDFVNGCVIYGPAYKGIAIASALASWMSFFEDVTVRYSHDRKEEKDHGEKGRSGGKSTGRS